MRILTVLEFFIIGLTAGWVMYPSVPAGQSRQAVQVSKTEISAPAAQSRLTVAKTSQRSAPASSTAALAL